MSYFILALFLISFIGVFHSFFSIVFSNPVTNDKKLQVYDKINLHFISCGNEYSFENKDIIETFQINNSKENNLNEFISFIKRNYPNFNNEMSNMTPECIIKTIIPYSYVQDMLLYGNSNKEIYYQDLSISEWMIWKSINPAECRYQLETALKIMKSNRIFV